MSLISAATRVRCTSLCSVTTRQVRSLWCWRTLSLRKSSSRWRRRWFISWVHAVLLAEEPLLMTAWSRYLRDTHTHTSGRWVWKDWWFSYGQETIQMVNHEAVQGFVVNYFRSLEVGINMILSQYYCEFLFYFFNAILYVAISLQSDRVKLVITCNKFLMRQKLTVIVKNITSNPVYRKSHLTITFPLAAGWVKFSRVVLTDKASFKLMETR